jgi:nucleotide-binding universal stress UspA family protein
MSERIITLATLTYMRAQLLTAMLERNGINCFMANINRIKEGPGGVKVKIMEEDAEKAYRIYEDFRSSYGVGKEEAVEYLKSIRRILVPVDFTMHAENAANYAVNIASQLKADIKLINAYLDPMGTPQTYLESYSYQLNIDKVIREVEEETARSLDAMAERLKDTVRQRKIKGVDITYDLFKGNAVDVIISEIGEYHPGLVVMGTRGNELEGIRSFGSVTASLIEKAKVPVLAVPKDYDALEFNPPARVLYATNFDDTDFTALRRLVSFIRPFKAKLYCVHAAFEEANIMDEVQLRNIRRYLFDSMDEYNIECGLLETMDVQQGLEDFIEEQDIDVLAVTTHKRNFITRIFKRSMTRKFLFHAHIPLLVFQARA